jgi:hypothetical protein
MVVEVRPRIEDYISTFFERCRGPREGLSPWFGLSKLLLPDVIERRWEDLGVLLNIVMAV